MNSDITIEIPPGKYNRYCEQRPLVCSDKKKIYRAQANLSKKGLTSSEMATLYLHDLVGCDGLEFVAFGNIRLSEPVVLPGNINLVPCFLSDIDGKNIGDELVQLTEMMRKRSRFIYDGWLPISDWRIDNVRKAIRRIDQALSIFSLQEEVSFSWKPKYNPVEMSPSSYIHFKHQHIQEVEELIHFTESLTNEDDSKALFRSIAWLSQSIRLTEPAARFLFSILAIESLADYIEKSAKDDSIFAQLKSSHLTKTERKARREECIETTLDKHLKADPRKAIDLAYSNCIKGITQRLKTHLETMFGNESEPVDLLFNTKVEEKTLYELRHTIAHGTADALSETQREIIYARVWDAERIARLYILKVLERVVGKPLFVQQMTASMNIHLDNVIITNEKMYKGPIDMASVYYSEILE